MGGILSMLMGSTEGNGLGLGSGLGDLPESCTAMILGRLSPQEVLRFGKLNKTFNQASWADVVWEPKLPDNYEFLVCKFYGDYYCGKNLSKREIYRLLCGPIRFDSATKEIWMDKSNGKMFMSISWKGLRVTGINDRRYWTHIPSDESRFHTIAYLQQVWWLEAEGEIESIFPAGTYSLFFRIQLGKTTKRFGRRVCNIDQVHGWGIKPVRFQLSTSNGQCTTRKCFLKEVGNWKNYHAGKFTVVKSQDLSMKIKFSMAQIDCTHTKGGLCLDSVLICPSN